jgi:hypothetical protein
MKGCCVTLAVSHCFHVVETFAAATILANNMLGVGMGANMRKPPRHNTIGIPSEQESTFH